MGWQSVGAAVLLGLVLGWVGLLVVVFALKPEVTTTPRRRTAVTGSLAGRGSTHRVLTGLLVLALAAAWPAAAASENEGVGDRPAEKRCIEGRQTEDPMSPPCVPFFEGDNGGDTSGGVEEDRVTVLLYVDVGRYGAPSHPETTPVAGTYVRGSDPPRTRCGPRERDPEVCDHVLVRVVKAFQRYFNDRFQTYGRKVEFWVYFSGARSAADRRLDAAENWEHLRPFAVLDQATFYGHNASYVDAMAARGTMVLGSLAELTNAGTQKNAPRVWDFWPDTERRADLFTSYVCQKVAPYPVRRYGHPSGLGSPNGGPRRFGLYYTTDPGRPGLRYFAELVKAGLEDCGVAWEGEGTFPRAGYGVDGGDLGADQLRAALEFRARGVTTVLWLGGVETRFTQWAGLLGYHPAIVLAGDGDLDTNATGIVQHPTVWQNAWGPQYLIRTDRVSDSWGARAYREGSPLGPDSDLRYAHEAYRDHLMLFTAIQVAGPVLTPGNVRDGLWAMPPRGTPSPYDAACFYELDDYSCVKDGMEVWWDPAGRRVETTTPGCMRMVREGERSLPWAWTGEDEVFKNPGDPCNETGGPIRMRAG